MRTSEEINKEAKAINGSFPGIPSIARMLALVVEVLLDIRDAKIPEPVEKE
jgi:hypothetical protein